MKKLLSFLIAAMLFASVCCAEDLHTRDDVRAEYIRTRQCSSAVPVAVNASFSPYSLSETDESAKEDALSLISFMRWLAYMPDDITDDPELDVSAAHAACILAANDILTHEPEKPADMDDVFYEACLNAARSCNIASLNWENDSSLRIAVELMMLDDDDHNLLKAGHRRWFLSPSLGRTGISAAESGSGNLYTAFYALDDSESADWDYIAWPSAGAFPAEYITPEMPWTVSLNPEIYDLEASEPVIYIDNGNINALPPAGTQCGNSYFVIDTEPVGGAPALIFRPDIGDEYSQNMKFTVTINGLVGRDGEKRPLSYDIELISLEPIRDMAVELSDTELTLSTGWNFLITANVIPAWCDNTSVYFSSSDESVVTVDEAGLLTALAPGTAEITACTATGRTDVCKVTVTE